MSLGIVLAAGPALFLIAAVPGWPHSRNWGYVPMSVLGLALSLVLVSFIAVPV